MLYAILNINSSLYFLLALLRGICYKPFLKKSGKGLLIQHGFLYRNLKYISVGHHVYIGHNSEIYSNKKGVEIGNHVMISPHVIIIGQNHAYNNFNLPMDKQKQVYKNIIIKDDVWIGTRAIILPGVIVNKGAIVGAGAVVTKNVNAYSIVGGVPAKHIKYRFSKNVKLKK